MTVLMDTGYSVEWRQYPMQHSVCPDEIRDIGRWLRKVLKA
jgi:phospholipase/carboxylesterase